jgi:hypothetical protein
LNSLPKHAQPATSLFEPASQQPVGEYDCIHGAGARAGYADDVYLRLFKEVVQHTPNHPPGKAMPSPPMISLMAPDNPRLRLLPVQIERLPHIAGRIPR